MGSDGFWRWLRIAFRVFIVLGLGIAATVLVMSARKTPTTTPPSTQPVLSTPTSAPASMPATQPTRSEVVSMLIASQPASQPTSSPATLPAVDVRNKDTRARVAEIAIKEVLRRSGKRDGKAEPFETKVTPTKKGWKVDVSPKPPTKGSRFTVTISRKLKVTGYTRGK